MNHVYFDDLRVGDRFTSDVYVVNEDAIIAFAREFDVQPFHLDHAAANKSVFGGLAASGWHTAAIAMRLFTTGPLQFVGGAVGLGVDELRWPVAVRAGDIVQLETEIIEARESRFKALARHHSHQQCDAEPTPRSGAQLHRKRDGAAAADKSQLSGCGELLTLAEVEFPGCERGYFVHAADRPRHPEIRHIRFA